MRNAPGDVVPGGTLSSSDETDDLSSLTTADRVCKDPARRWCFSSRRVEKMPVYRCPECKKLSDMQRDHEQESDGGTGTVAHLASCPHAEPSLDARLFELEERSRDLEERVARLESFTRVPARKARRDR